MSGNRASRLRFNFGFLLEAENGTSRSIELDYPSIRIEDDLTLEPLRGTFQAIRNSKGIYITGHLHSNTETDCARCLKSIVLPISFRLDDLFYYPPKDVPPGEYVVGEDGFIDLAPLVRQLSLLEVPMQLFCVPGCKGLCVECGQDLNENSCDCETETIDPRLEKLRTLLDS